MAKKKVYYSIYYDDDASRVQQVVNMGVVEGQQMLSGQKWEEVKKKGKQAIEDWIATEMRGKECLVVLIGTNTSKRPWVKYENRKGLGGRDRRYRHLYSRSQRLGREDVNPRRQPIQRRNQALQSAGCL